jgi:hypothetical protein
VRTSIGGESTVRLIPPEHPVTKPATNTNAYIERFIAGSPDSERRTGDHKQARAATV